MMKNHAQALGDAAFGTFSRFLTTKVRARRGKVQTLGRFYPSSKTRSRCGHRRASLSLSERVYQCPTCGVEIDRNLNAAINLLNEALRLSALNL